MSKARKHFGRYFWRVPFWLVLALASTLVHAGPRILYTDILTGPNTGGEGDNGAYLTIFGIGFGAVQGGSRVTIKNSPVAVYKQWSDTRITVQPGSSVSSGAIRVIVSGESSNADNSFTVVSGKLFFVALNGNDTSGRAGEISRPFRSAQNTFDRRDFGPGDHLILRGGNWTDNNKIYDAFLSIHHKSGTVRAPIVVMGYPTESANVLRTGSNGVSRAIHAYATDGHYVIANLRINMNGGGGSCIGLAVGTENVRVVNNEGQGMFEDSGGSACIAGSGKGYRVLGNHVHHNGGSKLYHALYIDARDTTRGGPGDIEIAYNHIHHQTGGRGIQIYGDTGTLINNVRVHHNVIHDIALDGILFGRDSGTGFLAYNNVVYRTADPSLRGPITSSGSGGGCIRFDSPNLVARVYNNTFADCAVDNDPDSGGIRFQRAKEITLVNNIISGKHYVNVGAMPTSLVSTNNLWSSGGFAPFWDTRSVSGDPRFVDPSAGDFRLQRSSPAIDRGSPSASGVVLNDLEGTARPQGAGYDIGAFEFVQSAPSQP
jgi:hypothetical protein